MLNSQSPRSNTVPVDDRFDATVVWIVRCFAFSGFLIHIFALFGVLFFFLFSIFLHISCVHFLGFQIAPVRPVNIVFLLGFLVAING
jgi:hypothetical protein